MASVSRTIKTAAAFDEDGYLSILSEGQTVSLSTEMEYTIWGEK